MSTLKEVLNGTWYHFSPNNSPLPPNAIVASCATNPKQSQVWMSVWISLGIGIPAEPWGLILTDGETWTEFKFGEFNLPSGTIQNIAVDSKGGAWLSFLNKGICYFDGQSAKIYEYDNMGIAIRELAITDLFIGNVDEIWMTSLINGAYELVDDVWQRNHISELCISQRILLCGEDQEGNFCLACEEDTITRFLIKHLDGWEQICSIPIGFKHSNQVTCFAIDRHDRVWVGSKTEGLQVWDDQSWNKLTENDNSLLYGEIKSLKMDENDNLWVGTPGGFVLFDGAEWYDFGAIIQNPEMQVVSRKDLLPGGLSSQQPLVFIGDYIVIDNLRRKWFNASTGIVMFSPENKE